MSQIGKTRVYTSIDEKTDPDKTQCPVCKVFAVPRSITSTRTEEAVPTGEHHCPNCGHVYGRGLGM